MHDQPAGDNATWLFIQPTRAFHHSESFWTSVFALQLLLASRLERPAGIPAYQYIEDHDGWRFEPDGELTIPRGLALRDVVVQGKLRDGFIENVGVAPGLRDLSPDVIVIQPDRVIIVEVKTVGYGLAAQQKANYERLAATIRDSGRHCDLFFLISAGNENPADLRLLRANAAAERGYRLLLWEQVLKHMCEGSARTELGLCMGHISRFYTHEERYLRGGPNPPLQPTGSAGG